MISHKVVSVVGNIASDKKSRIRGVGRYVAGLEETLFSEGTYRSQEVLSQPADCSINPFFNLLAPPRIDAFRYRSKKRVAILHDVIPLQFPEYFPVGLRGKAYVYINKFLAGVYNHIVTDSQASARTIQQLLHIPPHKMSVAYPFSSVRPDVAQTTSALLPPPIKAQEYFLYVGDVNWHKNIVAIAKSAVQTKQMIVFVGGAFLNTNTSHPWLRELQEFSVIAKENPHLIITTGYVNDNVLATLYENAVANVLVSHEEGFGYSFIEAGAFKTPSILSDKPIFHEISADKGALFVDHTSTESIVQAMEKLLRDPRFRQTLGMEAMQRSLFFSKSSFQKAWQNIIESI